MRTVHLLLAAAPFAAAFAPSPIAHAPRSVRGAVSPAANLRAASLSSRTAPVRLGLRMAAVESSVASSETLKGDLMTQLSVGSGLKGAADAANRAEINELVLKLESQNPSENAAGSSLLNGVWELLYTGGCDVLPPSRCHRLATLSRHCVRALTSINKNKNERK